MTKERAEEIKFLTTNTFIPVTFVAVMAGSIFFVSLMYARTAANTNAIQEIKETSALDQRAINEKFERILQELNYLKGRLDAQSAKQKRGE